MTNGPSPDDVERRTDRGVRATTPHRHVLIARIVAGVPLFTFGLAHVFVPAAAMRPLVDAAGFPFPAIVSPIGVAVQIVAGLSLLLGLWARVGAAMGVVSMMGAIYAHIVFDEWPGEMASGPPDALPVIVLVAALYVLWRGAGRWSLDRAAAS